MNSSCQQCGAKLPSQKLGGLCPRCVGRRLLAAAPKPGASDEEALGRKIGRYKLVQKLGEGGGGLVYAADQEEPVRRRVALKILKLGMDTRAVVARFEAERQALAMMDHPNIAKVFDAGATDTGRPYFVMELVTGVRITDYCNQHQLDTEARLELFITVCQAVQHAHQKGVIHRDLKPSNILVTTHDGVPVPKIIDFGIAKATEQKLTEDTLVTEQHHLLGTPAYMSPEQLERGGLDMDTRSDLYSLGVVLYELLTGTTPFDARALRDSGPDEMRKTIREVEPPRPSTRVAWALPGRKWAGEKGRNGAGSDLDSPSPPFPEAPFRSALLCGDLDWIVMKCLEKDRTRRYETANALAQDLRRHLADEPVTAAAPTLRYQFGKFARRNKTALAVATLLLTVLLVATGVSAWLAVRATFAERIARERLGESERLAKKPKRSPSSSPRFSKAPTPPTPAAPSPSSKPSNAPHSRLRPTPPCSPPVAPSWKLPSAAPIAVWVITAKPSPCWRRLAITIAPPTARRTPTPSPP